MTTVTTTGGSVGTGWVHQVQTYRGSTYYADWTVNQGYSFWGKTGEKRPLPKGFKYPTAYSAYFYHGAWDACVNGYVTATDSQGIACTRTGALIFNYQWSNVPGSLSSFDEAAATRAILKVRSNLKGQRVNLGVAFLERKQTAALFGDATKTVGRAIECALSHDWRGLKKTLKLSPKLRKKEKVALRTYGRSPKSPVDKRRLASDLWLSNAYGLQPTLADLKGSVETLCEQDLGDPQRYKMKVVGMATIVERPNLDTVANTDVGGRALITRKTLKKSCAKVRLDVNLPNPALVAAQSLGLTNPAVWLWEKTPWSFVVDWLLPIGAYLDSMDATLGWDFRAGSITRRLEWEVSQLATLYSQDGWHDCRVEASGSFGFKRIDRSVLIDFPFPRKFFDLVKNPLSTGHLLNALALKGSRYR